MAVPQDIEVDVADVGRIETVPAILDLVCDLTGMGFAAVARVTESHWVACSVLDKIGFGLEPGGELKVKTTICDEIRQSGRAVTIDDVAADSAFCTHATPAMYGFRSYISVPLILRDGQFFGTLCAIDPKPALVSSKKTIRSFELWADLIAFHIDAIRKLARSEASLRDAREVSELREQFIAVLGHDLRSPLTAISAGVSTLESESQSDSSRRILALMAQSARRGMGIVDNVLDFARGRLGSGIELQHSPQCDLRSVIEQVVAEHRTAHAGRLITCVVGTLPEIRGDASRLGQLLSNLIGNALTHGDPAGEVGVRASLNDAVVEVAVSNRGPEITADILGNLFRPFFRGAPATRGKGLGLGLYIASEIARAHQARLTVESDADATTFTLRLPIPAM